LLFTIFPVSKLHSFGSSQKCILIRTAALVVLLLVEKVSIFVKSLNKLIKSGVSPADIVVSGFSEEPDLFV